MVADFVQCFYKLLFSLIFFILLLSFALVSLLGIWVSVYAAPCLSPPISGSGIIPLASLLDLILLFCKLQTSGTHADLSVLLRRAWF